MDNAQYSAKSQENENLDPNSLKESFKKEIDSTISKVKTEGKNALETRKDDAASQLHNFAHATEQAAQSLAQKDESSWAAPYLRKTAGQIENYAQLLQTRPINRIIEDGATLARNNPTTFVIGSLIAGVCISRFFRSSSTHSLSSDRNRSNNSQSGQYRSDSQSVYTNAQSRHNPQGFNTFEDDYSNSGSKTKDELTGNKNPVYTQRSTPGYANTAGTDNDKNLYGENRENRAYSSEPEFEKSSSEI